MKLKIFTLIGIFFSVNLNAGDAMSAKVTFAGINSKGQVFVTFDKPLIQDGCAGQTQLLLPSDSEIRNQILSIALAAKASGRDVTIKPAGCQVGNPSLLATYSPHGWFYMN